MVGVEVNGRRIERFESPIGHRDLVVQSEQLVPLVPILVVVESRPKVDSVEIKRFTFEVVCDPSDVTLVVLPGREIAGSIGNAALSP